MEQNFAGLVLERLAEDYDSARSQWNDGAAENGTATRYFVVDDLLPAPLANEVYNAFPDPSGDWFVRSTFREKKRTLATIGRLDRVIQQVDEAFHDHEVVAQFGRITGIDGLQSDPSLYGAGISLMVRGDFLNPHIDNSHDGQRQRYRRLNLLFYVSPDWHRVNGGNLELWDDAVLRPVTIEARFNRLLVMETGPRSWHSVDPVSVSGRRCCISNYFFTNESPTGGSYHHVTSFLGRPDQPMRRLIGRCDNFLRQSVSNLTGAGRGRRRLNQ